MRLSKEAFVAHWKHEIAGMVFDAATWKAQGSELSLRLSTLMEKVEKRLAQMYECLEEVKIIPPQNGGGGTGENAALRVAANPVKQSRPGDQAGTDAERTARIGGVPVPTKVAEGRR